MFFPEVEHAVYEKNTLSAVTAQLRFPTILRVETEQPTAFQEATRHLFPRFGAQPYQLPLPASAVQPHMPPQIQMFMQSMVPGAMGRRYFMSTNDDSWRMVISRDTFEIATKAYTKWSDFRERFKTSFEAFVSAYRPASFSRIGLRYVNEIRRSQIGLADVPWSELLQPYILGPFGTKLLEPEVDNLSSRIHFGLKEKNRFLWLQTGLKKTKDQQDPPFLIDGDFHTHSPTEIDDAFGTIDRFNRDSYQLFRWCIQSRLHNALIPRDGSNAG